MKGWVTVHQHRGYDVQVLSISEPGDDMGYRVSPPLANDQKRYDTVGDAVKAIDRHAAITTHRIERLKRIAADHGVNAKFQHWRGRLYCNLNGAFTFVVKGDQQFERKCIEAKNNVPQRIDLTGKLAKIEEQAVKAML